MNKAIINIYNSKYFSLIVLITLIAIGAYLRIRQLNTDFWYDEAFTGVVIRQDWGNMFELIRLDRVHPPTFYIVMKSWTTLFGSSIDSIRSFIILQGLTLVPFAYLFFKMFESNKEKAKVAGLTAATLLAFSPFFTAYSVEARSYSFLAMMGCISLYFFWKAISTGPITQKPFQLKYWTLWAIAVLTIIATHYFSIILLTGYGLIILIKIFQEKGISAKKNFWKYFWGTLFVLMIMTVVIVNITSLSYSISSINTSWIPATDFTTIFRSMTSFLFGVGRQIPGVPPFNEFVFSIKSQNISFIIAITSLIATINLYHKFKQTKDIQESNKLYYLTAMTFTPLLAFSLTSALGLNTLVERYAIIYGAFFLIWLAYIWTQTYNKGTFILLAIYLIGIQFLIPPKPVTFYSELQDAIMTVTSTQSQKYDQLIIHDPTDYVLMRYYLEDPKNMYVQLPTGGNYASWALIPRLAEVHSYKDCTGTCLYAINKVWVTDEMKNDSRLEILKESNRFMVYKVTSNR